MDQRTLSTPAAWALTPRRRHVVMAPIAKTLTGRTGLDDLHGMHGMHTHRIWGPRLPPPACHQPARVRLTRKGGVGSALGTRDERIDEASAATWIRGRLRLVQMRPALMRRHCRVARNRSGQEVEMSVRSGDVT